MATCYRFGRVEVRPAERQIVVEGQPAPVGARAFDVLMALIDRRERVVTKDELLDIVWPGLVVEENNLQVQVSTLRKVLGARSVATIPGRGYRFTLEPEMPDAPMCDLSAPRHNLPAQLNRFIGREHEIGEVKSLLADSRLVTLCSLGGTGKTRLSLQVAHELVNQFPDGAWFVELAPVTDEARVPPAVAAALGVQQQHAGSLLDALAAFVRDRNMLLVLDNCEHVVRAAAEVLKHLLQASPSVHVLASSREPLHVAGETVFPLSPLPTPDPRYGTSTEILGQYDAVRLFADRAAAASPGFQLTDANVDAVATICRRLDGIPLAIELAAARVRSLSVENIAARLDDRFHLLTRGDQTAAPRQQTLRASLDWSYELLTPEEAILLRRLAVFVGGWTLEAAEAVGAGSDVPRDDVLDLLGRLVERSLVDVDAYGERYRLLETVRQYTFEKLVASGELHGVRERHVAFFVDLAVQCRSKLIGPDEASWLRRLDDELDNMLAAHAAADVARKLLMLRSIRHYFVNRGLLGLAHKLACEVLGQSDPDSDEYIQALFDVGQSALPLGLYDESRMHLEESLALARRKGDRNAMAIALQPLGHVCMAQGDLSAASGHLQAALAMALENGKDREIAGALNALGHLHRAQGDMDSAAKLYEEAVVYARRLKGRIALAVSLLNQAMASSALPLPNRATMVLEVLELTDEGSPYVGQIALDASAGLAALGGAFECAAKLYGAAESLAARTGIRRDVVDEAFVAPLVAAARAHLGVRYSDLEVQGRALTYGAAIEEARACLAGLR